MNQGFEVFPLGSDVRVYTGTNGFVDADSGDALDPENVFLSVKSPTASTVIYEYGVGDTIERDTVGKYSAVIDASEPGDWYFRWWSTGDGKASSEERFRVEVARAV